MGGTWRRWTGRRKLIDPTITETDACYGTSDVTAASAPTYPCAILDGDPTDDSALAAATVFTVISGFALQLIVLTFHMVSSTVCASAAAARCVIDKNTRGLRRRRACSAAVRIEAARYTQRRPRERGAAGIRATCRRVEAGVLAYLLVSCHAFAEGAGRGNGWARRNTDKEQGPMGYSDPGPAVVATMSGWRCGQAHGNTTLANAWRTAPCKVCSQGGYPWYCASRIGEAANPGPLQATLAAGGLLRRIGSKVASAVSYPRPGTGCLRGAIAPGFGEHRMSGGDGELYALSVEAVNSTGWKALQRRLQATTSHAVLAQETWVTQDSIPAASAWAKRRGWKSVWSAAQAGPNGGAAGGVAIFVRDEFGLQYPPGGSHEWHPGRVVAAVLEAPEHRPLLLISSYLVHGVGPGAENLELLAKIGARAKTAAQGMEMLMGGDANMEPPDFALTGFETETDTVVLHPSTRRGTFRTARSASLLDYFVVSTRTAAAVDKVEALEAAGIKGHVPVRLTFKPRATTVRALQLRKPPRLQTERVYGPLPPPPDWRAPQAAAEAALTAARQRRDDTQLLLDEAYRQWADLAEVELADWSGQPPKKWGERGRLPRFVWRSVLPEVTPVLARPYAATAAWIGAVLGELGRINGAVRTNPRQVGEAEPMGADPPLHDDHDQAARERQREAEIRSARARRPPTGPRACASTLREVVGSIREDCPDCGDTDEGHVLRGYRDAAHALATQLLDEVESLMLGASLGGNDGRDDGNGTMDDRLTDINRRISELRDNVATLEAKHTAEADAEEKRQWKEWVAEGIDKGAGRAHAYTKTPNAWAPTVVELPEGGTSAAIDELMDGQRRKYSEMWRPAAHPFRYDWEDLSELPRMTPDRLREVAASFSSRTSTTFDGFHPRELGHLSDGALEALAALYAAAEVAAIWPRQISLVVAALLPKPKGGYRPIGMAPAAYRLWSKARRVEADAWERQHERPYFSASKNNGPLDTVWRLAARQEAGTAQGEVAGTLSEDIQAFFESIDRDRLVAEARALGFPMAIVRAALAEYSAARVVSMHGRIGRELYPTTGVVAGCSLAMILTKV